MNEINKNCCAVCGVEFEKGTGRYLFNENNYCSICWNNEQNHKEINESNKRVENNSK